MSYSVLIANRGVSVRVGVNTSLIEPLLEVRLVELMTS